MSREQKCPPGLARSYKSKHVEHAHSTKRPGSKPYSKGRNQTVRRWQEARCRPHSAQVRHFGTKPGTPKLAVFALEAVTRTKEYALPSDGTNCFLVHLDALGERAELRNRRTITVTIDARNRGNRR